MMETDKNNSAHDETTTRHRQNTAPNVSKRLEIRLNLIVDTPEYKSNRNFKSSDKANQCSGFVYSFLRKIVNTTFPPGKFETPYNFTLDFKEVVPACEGLDVKISLLTSNGFEANGLTCRFENNMLSIGGTPSNPQGFDGDVKIVVSGSFYDVKEIKDSKTSEICRFPVASSFLVPFASKKFVLNPDPDSLWEDNPTPKDAPFKKPDADVWSGTTSTIPLLTVLGASQRGRSHAQIGSFRDDHFLIRLGENLDDWNFVAVADGAGSACFSREGSRIACEAWINDPKGGIATLYKSHQETLKQEINSLLCHESDSSEFDFSQKLSNTNLEKLFYYSVCYAWYAINNASTNAKAKINDFNTTLLCAAFKRLPKTEQTPPRWVILSYWVGDGGLAILRPNGKSDVLPLGTPDGGEFAGQTRFLTMKPELEEKAICGRLRLAVVEDFQALVLATDGITDPFFPAEANLSDYTYWQRFWNETLPKEFPGVLDVSKKLEERGQALLGGLKFKSKGNHDDRTLVLVLNDAFGSRQEVKDETFVTEEKTQADESCGTIDNTEEDVLTTPGGSMDVESLPEENKPLASPLEVGAVENGVVEDETFSSTSSNCTTECSDSDVESNSGECLEPSVSQEGEGCTYTDPTCEAASDYGTSASAITLEKNGNNAEGVTDELHVSKESPDKLAPPPSEIVPPVFGTPTEELVPPHPEITIPAHKTADENIIPSFVD